MTLVTFQGSKLISREGKKISDTVNKQISTKEKCKNDVSIDKLAA